MTYEIASEERAEQPTLVATATLTVAEIGPWLARTYGAVAAAAGGAIAGPPFARYHPLGGDRFEVEAGFPVSSGATGGADVHLSSLPGGAVAVTIHVGPYDAMAPAYEALRSWVDEHGGGPAGDAWEVYHSDPEAQPDPATWRTDVVQPYRTAA